MKNKTFNWIAASLLLVHAVAAQAQDVDAKLISITNPMQSNGIHIGDVLERKVVIETSQPYQLSKTTLPMKGLSRDGIELSDIDVNTRQQGNKTLNEITLRYQVFMSSPTPVVVQLPEEVFAMAGGAKALMLKLPVWRFWFSPLVAADITTAKGNLQPQFKPALIATETDRVLLAVLLGLVVVGGLGLVYVNADRRWMPFMGGAFARAHREIKRLPRTAGQDRKALFLLHQAFNQTHGANLFAAEIGRFIASHPAFAKARPDIEKFFKKSNQSLFTQAQPDRVQFMQALTTFSKTLRDCERGVA